MKETTAQTFLEVVCTCPYCGAIEDILKDVKEVLEYDHRASNIDKEIKCSECSEIFIVTDINF